MKLRALLTVFGVLLAPAALVAGVPNSPAVSSEPEQFQVTQKTEVPNTTLQPGSYSIRILDHLRDRVIVQVSGKGNRVETTFLAVPASTMANAPQGPISYSAGPKGKAALKGFAFPGGLAVEFVYPKNDAVSIAQANGTRVMAIDPASEGRAPAPNLNQDDMQMITLWMLEPSRVGPNDAKATGIAATKYQAPPSATEAAPAETAQAQPAAQPQPAAQAQPAAPVADTSAATASTYNATTTSDTPATRPARRQRPVQLAQNDTPPPPPVRTHARPANVKTLPHTASDLPWLWIVAFVSLLSGVGLRFRRLALQA